MYSRDDTVAALLDFYRQILKLPYIDESDLITPPASGWDSIDEEALRAQGKTDSVIDLLRHLPYIHAPRRDGPIIAYETVCTDYTVDSTHFLEDEYPLPGHCVYLTEGEGHEGYCLILDTERGTTTAWSVMGYEERNGESDDETLPKSEQWTTHSTQPTAGFFADWSLRYEKLVWMLTPTYKHNWGSFLSLVDNRPQEAELCQREMKTWHPDLSQVETDGGDESSKEWRILGLMHTANVHNMHLECGWGSASFNKQECRARLLELEKQYSMEKKRLMDSTDPDAGSFN